MPTLTGTEQLWVVPVQTTGTPSANQEQCSAQDIANTATDNVGTFTANGATSVVVANTAVTANSVIVTTIKTVGGTVSPNALNVKTITPGTGFTISGTASDTSVYNYIVLN